MLALPATGLLDNILTGGKTLGSTVVEGADSATSAPTVAYLSDGAIEATFVQNIPQRALNGSTNLDLTFPRTIFVTEVLVIKTGDTGIAGDQVTINKGAAGTIATVALNVANGVVTRVTTLFPRYQFLDPTTANGFLRLTYTAPVAGATDTRCIVIVRYLRANGI
jgi:hypothetical protein